MYVVKLDKEYHEFLNSYWNYYETYLLNEKNCDIKFFFNKFHLGILAWTYLNFSEIMMSYFLTKYWIECEFGTKNVLRMERNTKLPSSWRNWVYKKQIT